MKKFKTLPGNKFTAPLSSLRALGCCQKKIGAYAPSIISLRTDDWHYFTIFDILKYMTNQSIQPFKKALASLEKAIAQPLNEFTRDSVVQRFEYTFELSWKNLERYLATDRPLKDDSVRGILREAHQRQLISNIQQWFAFQKCRNLTSDTYNEDTAEEVYKEALKLPALCHELVINLEKKLNDNK
jgi:nucleotidyltransferase substrate binding protein (TIGR01987 family)